MKVTAIFATTAAGQFGVDGGLPWGNSAPDDLQFFKNMTMGNAMIMGYNTYHSVQHLQGRDKIVISTRAHNSFPTQGATYFVTSMDEAIKLAESRGHRDAYIIGGAMVLRENAHLADEVLWSCIPGSYPADIYLDVEKITKDRALVDSNVLSDGTKVHIFGESVPSSVLNTKTALEEALDEAVETTFGNIPIKKTLEFTEDIAKGNALDITKQMIRPTQ